MRENKQIKLPELSLIVLIGASGSGKSTFAAKYFKPAEIVSSDKCRALVSNDENNQSVSSDAFALARWLSLTENGGEGMVIKPYNFVERDKKGIVQPAVKVRGKEYLRIIYGPEYTSEENLDRLRSCSLNAKRSLAMREFALGAEGLERFINKEPLNRVHQCAFGVLALESEPVDPRL